MKVIKSTDRLCVWITCMLNGRSPMMYTAYMKLRPKQCHKNKLSQEVTFAMRKIQLTDDKGLILLCIPLLLVFSLVRFLGSSFICECHQLPIHISLFSQRSNLPGVFWLYNNQTTRSQCLCTISAASKWWREHFLMRGKLTKIYYAYDTY